MKRADKIIIRIFKLLGVLILLLGISLYIIAITYAVDYEAVGLMESDVKTLAIGCGVTSILLMVVSGALKSKIKNDNPIIKMSQDGFIDNGPLEVGLIPWSNIEKFTIYEVMNGYNSRKYLGIWVKDLGELCKKLPAAKVEMIKANAAGGAPPVVIPQTLIKEDLNKVIEKIMLYRKEISYRD